MHDTLVQSSALSCACKAQLCICNRKAKPHVEHTKLMQSPSVSSGTSGNLVFAAAVLGCLEILLLKAVGKENANRALLVQPSSLKVGI